MGLVSEQPPKYTSWEDLQLIKNVIKSQNKTRLETARHYLRCAYDIDWERKSLDLRTGQIICEWWNDRNAERDFRE